jgi:phosphohistidine phosphatase SixA
MSKTLTLVRHGDYTGSTLTQAGRDDIDNVGGQLLESGVIPDIIVHSTVPRAAESARRLADVFNTAANDNGRPKVRLVPVGWLHEDKMVDLDTLAKLDKDATGAEKVLAVSHQPQVSGILYGFAGCDTSPGKAEAYVLETEEKTWASVAPSELKLVKTFMPKK